MYRIIRYHALTCFDRGTCMSISDHHESGMARINAHHSEGD